MDVCVLGRIGYDLYAVEHGRPLDEVQQFSRRLGGSSANIAVGLARLGLRVGIISCVGADALAPYLLSFLASEKVDTRFVRQVKGFNTSLCLTEVSPPDQFTQVFYRKQAADSLVEIGPEEVHYIQQARIFVTNGTSLASSPARQSTFTALRKAREGGVETILDIDYRESSWASRTEAGEQVRHALSWVDTVIGNEEEFGLVAGAVDPAAQMETIRGQGVKLVVRKLADKGVEAYIEGERICSPPYPAETVCTIGAGDGFAAGFLYGRYHNKSLAASLEYGNAAAAIVVSRVSCSDAMPYREELEAFVDNTGGGDRRDRLTPAEGATE